MTATAPAIETQRPGTYALILRARSAAQISVGRWGTLDVMPGYYIYVGSAFGPGGVSGRIQRHCRQNKTLRWHIDYLREVTTPVQAWCGYDSRDLEHRWAGIFTRLSGVISVSGFGCSDCRCESHLFFIPAVPESPGLMAAAATRPQIWPLQSVSAPQQRLTIN